MSNNSDTALRQKLTDLLERWDQVQYDRYDFFDVSEEMATEMETRERTVKDCATQLREILTK